MFPALFSTKRSSSCECLCPEARRFSYTCLARFPLGAPNDTGNGFFHCRPRLVLHHHSFTAARKSFLSRDACEGFAFLRRQKRTSRVREIVYVLKPNNLASFGLVRELEHKEKGSETPWLVLQKWHVLDPK